MIIIVEGIDRVGKTTLCNMLSEKLNIPIFKDSNIDSERDQVLQLEKMHSIISYMETVGENDVIFDRFNWSEYVYGLADRDYMSLEMLSSIQERLTHLGALFILVYPTDLERSEKEHGSQLSFHQYMFEKLFDSFVDRAEVIPCDYNTFGEVVELVKDVQTYLKEGV